MKYRYKLSPRVWGRFNTICKLALGLFLAKTVVNGTVGEIAKLGKIDPMLTMEADKGYYEDRYGDFETVVEDRRL